MCVFLCSHLQRAEQQVTKHHDLIQLAESLHSSKSEKKNTFHFFSVLHPGPFSVFQSKKTSFPLGGQVSWLPGKNSSNQTLKGDAKNAFALLGI